jgi:hypothetical protein
MRPLYTVYTENQVLYEYLFNIFFSSHKKPCKTMPQKNIWFSAVRAEIKNPFVFLLVWYNTINRARAKEDF